MSYYLFDLQMRHPPWSNTLEFRHREGVCLRFVTVCRLITISKQNDSHVTSITVQVQCRSDADSSMVDTSAPRSADAGGIELPPTSKR